MLIDLKKQNVYFQREQLDSKNSNNELSLFSAKNN